MLYKTNYREENKRCKKVVYDLGEFTNFIKDRYNIQEDLEIENYYIDPAIDYAAIAYSYSKGKISINYRFRELAYYLDKIKELSNLKDGVKFLIYHELGHFHDIDYKNQNVNSYLEKLLIDDVEFGQVFPESEANRYAVSKLGNFIDTFSKFVALYSFLYRSRVNSTINFYEKYLSNSNWGYPPHIYSISSFSLTKEMKEKITTLSYSYLNQIKKHLKLSLLGGIKEI